MHVDPNKVRAALEAVLAQGNATDQLLGQLLETYGPHLTTAHRSAVQSARQSWTETRQQTQDATGTTPTPTPASALWSD